MTNKVYKSAQGKMVDLGTIMLQNEHVRAVVNMKVNARGDKLDSLNQVIETRTERIQRHNERTSTNVSSAPPQTSAKKTSTPKQKVEPNIQIQSRGHVNENNPDPVAEPESLEPVESRPPVQNLAVPVETPVVQATPIVTQPRVPDVDLKNPARPQKSPVTNTSTQPNPSGGLAGAIARSREIKQELDRTRRQQSQDNGLRKI
jgi:hypothetical protein